MIEFADRFQPELLPGESAHWTGQPSPTVIFHKEDVFMIPFSLIWGGFAIVWELGVLGYGLFGSGTSKSGPSSFMALWGIPFVVIGQYMIWGRFLHAAWRKKRIFYAVTNRRVLILADARTRSLNAAMLETIPIIQKVVRRDGIGTLTFGAPISDRSKDMGSWSGISTSGTPTFVDIPDAEQVHALVTRLRNESLPSRSF